MTPSLDAAKLKSFYPEIVIGFVAPSGVGFDRVTDTVRRELERHDYIAQTVRLSGYLEELADLPKRKAQQPQERIPALQTTGDTLRAFAGADILGFVAAGLIRKSREQLNQTGSADPEDGGRPEDRQVAGMAFLVWSLKHPDEVSALRGIYGSRFFLISVFAPREQRVAWLSEDMASRSRSAKGPERFDLPARGIIDRDANEGDDRSDGQNVRGTFPMADFFVDASDDPALETTVHRSIDIVFGHPFETPTRDEFGMYVAHAAKLRSAELGRQVGAAISMSSGDVISTGTNEVPAFGGGHYWPSPLEKRRDTREFRRGKDQSDEDKRLLAAEVFDNFKRRGWIEPSVDASDTEIYGALENTSLQDITEYGRAVHAEMSAITDAARRGVSTAGSTIYVTTFPCHTCARHVVAAGIARLVYIEPYAKSRATKLHGDVLATPDTGSFDDEHVRFEPFIGAAPRQYINAFTMGTRKEDGAAVRSDEKRPPRLVGESTYAELDVAAHIQRERSAVAASLERIHEAEEELLKKGQEKKNGNE